MSVKNALNVTFDVAKLGVKNPAGTAKLLSAVATAERAKNAGVNAAQFQSIFTDLQNFSTSQVEGFMNIAHGILHGEINIPATLDISSPNTDPLVQDN